ncbi:signal peptidase I [Acholeplasma granularum]|uniref:signal peptidase I n=1 Tax=Acholeplasma granularum TaxID=264635 RepID=UPI00046ECC6D|nr:signal peptidase I [Acholeplasma granularum]
MSTNQKVFKYLGIVGNVLFYLLLLILLLFSISNLSIRSEKDLPNLFGKGFVSILSGSMEGEEKDNFNKGSLVFIDVLSDKQKEDLKVGQIVVFYDNVQRIHIIHRIKSITGNTVVTQGDVNASLYGSFDGTNYNSDMQLEASNINDVIGLYTGHITGVGSFIQEVRTPNGLLLWVVLPLFILFSIEAVILIRYIIARNKQKLEAKHEAEKEALRLEIEKELLERNKK